MKNDTENENEFIIYIYIYTYFKAEVERVQKYSTQVKVPLHYWNFT